MLGSVVCQHSQSIFPIPGELGVQAFITNNVCLFILFLERSCNVWVPGFGTDELKAYKRAPTVEAHKQRMALIKKTLKKY